jgi:hypothetical protein
MYQLNADASFPDLWRHSLRQGVVVQNTTGELNHLDC